MTIPHPTRAANDAAADRLLAVFCKVQGQPRVKYSDLDPMGRYKIASMSLEILNDAAPYMAISTASVIAAALDTAGEHAAATRVRKIADEWTAACPPPWFGMEF